MRPSVLLATLLLATAGPACATAPPAASAPAPDFTLPARDGGNVQLSALKGQVVMINLSRSASRCSASTSNPTAPPPPRGSRACR